MEVHLSTLEIIVGALAGLGVLLGGAGYLLSSYRDGRSKPAKEKLETENLLLENYEKQVKGFKEALEEATKELKKVQDENVKLKTINEQLIKMNEQYLAILQNNNPEMKEFIAEGKKAIKDHDEFHKKSAVVLDNIVATQEKIMNIMQDLHKMSSSNHELLNKDLKVEAVVTKN